MLPNCCIQVQTSPVERPAVPAWFAEVVLLVHHLADQGQIDALGQQVRLVRGRFGQYEPIDFLAVLIGYAISGERTLADFFGSVTPFGDAYMALFGRQRLPHRASLSRFLAAVDRPCLEAFRAVFQQHSFATGWDSETIGGIFDRQQRRYLVFDVDATRQAARQRALPCTAEFPAVRRRMEAVAEMGYTGRKRGDVVRTRTTALQMHTRQWIGTFAGRGNGDYLAELAATLHGIASYVHGFALSAEAALIRLDGQYGDTIALAQLVEAGMPFVTRARGYHILDHPHLQQVLTHPPTARMLRVNSNVTVDVFEGGWLPIAKGCPPVRILVVRRPAPGAGQTVTVGKCIGEWVYDVFLTTLPNDGFLAEDVLDLYQGRGAFEAVLADEDMEEDPDRWCSHTACGQELWQVVCQWVWNVRLALGKTLCGGKQREMEWAPPKETPPVLVPVPDPAPAYGPWQWAAAFGRATGRFGAAAFTLQEDGKLRCPAGATLWLSEVRQQDAFTQRAVYLAYQTDCQGCALREQCLAPGATGNRARRVSAVRRLLPTPVVREHTPVRLGPIRWVDVAGRALRRTWAAHWRRQYVEIVPLPSLKSASMPPVRPPREVRSHFRWRWTDRLAQNAWWGPPRFCISIAGVPSRLITS